MVWELLGQLIRLSVTSKEQCLPVYCSHLQKQQPVSGLNAGDTVTLSHCHHNTFVRQKV